VVEMVRRPLVAGSFYESNKAGLIASLEGCFVSKLGPGKLPQVRAEREGKLLGLVSPHAGHVYSGMGAAHAFYRLAQDGIPDVIVFLGPNHRGIGAPVAVSPHEYWQTPLGDLEVDRHTADAIIEHSLHASEDAAAHSMEHSIEVQLPFVQFISGSSSKIVPISIAHLNAEDAMALVHDLGPAIARAVEGKAAVIVASTDFSHYETAEDAREHDNIAIDRILALDGEGLINDVYREDISMCGVIGTAVMLSACSQLGATTAELLAYYSSGDVTGDRSEVVGYGALAVTV
jgi:MEMO1 family protein